MMRAAKSVSRMVDGNDDGNHQRLAPANRDGDENDDRNGGEAEMEQQFVGLFVGGLAIVAGDLDDRGLPE